MISSYKDFTIGVVDDSGYTAGSADNFPSYSLEYLNANAFYTMSMHGIRVVQDEEEISSAIICEGGGKTTIHDQSYIIKNDCIFICCGDSVHSLNIPTLKLNWHKELDLATCFGIYEFEDDFIIHGEMEISRLTKSGDILWNFSARDIFVTIDGKKEFEIIDDKIHLIDFQNYKYMLNSNGKLI